MLPRHIKSLISLLMFLLYGNIWILLCLITNMTNHVCTRVVLDKLLSGRQPRSHSWGSPLCDGRWRAAARICWGVFVTGCPVCSGCLKCPVSVGSISALHWEHLKGKFCVSAANKLDWAGFYFEKFNLQHVWQTFWFWCFNSFLDF